MPEQLGHHMRYNILKVKKCLKQCNFDALVGSILWQTLNINSAFRTAEHSNNLYKSKGCLDCEVEVVVVGE